MTLHEWKAKEYFTYAGDIYFFNLKLDISIRCPISYQNDIIIPNDYPTYISICLIGDYDDT